MKNKILVIMLLLIAISFSLTGCSGFNSFVGPGSSDYSYHVAGSYIVFRSSTNNIIVIHDPADPYAGTTPIIPSKVIEIAWDDKIIIAKQQGLKEKSKGSGYMIPDDNVLNYWILDTEAYNIYGPFNKEDFINQRKKLKVSDSLELKSVESYTTTKK